MMEVVGLRKSIMSLLMMRFTLPFASVVMLP